MKNQQITTAAICKHFGITRNQYYNGFCVVLPMPVNAQRSTDELTESLPNCSRFGVEVYANNMDINTARYMVQDTDWSELDSNLLPVVRSMQLIYTRAFIAYTQRQERISKIAELRAIIAKGIGAITLYRNEAKFGKIGTIGSTRVNNSGSQQDMYSAYVGK